MILLFLYQRVLQQLPNPSSSEMILPGQLLSGATTNILVLNLFVT